MPLLGLLNWMDPEAPSATMKVVELQSGVKVRAV
jgi:hypothetical protein